MNSKRWQDHFQQEFQNLSNSSQSPNGAAENPSPTGSSLLSQALEKSILSEEKYFSWAQNEYQLPLLKLSFFADRAIDGKVWQKYQTVYPWSPDCLPIAEWDGHLIVVCLEPKKLPQTLQVITILCPLSGLKQLWQSYQHTSEFQLSDEASADVDLSMPADHPEGLSAAIDSNADSSFEGLLTQTTTQVQLEKTIIQNIAPEEVRPVPANTPPSTPPIRISTAPPPFTHPVASESIIKEIPPPPKPVRETTPMATLSPLATKNSPVGSGREIYILDIIQKDKTQMFQTETRHAFTQMKESFTCCMLLSTDTKGLFVKPISGDESFVSNPSAAGISLGSASIFRIVDKTQKPFHGPVSLNEINEKFFDDWNKGSIPSHVTLVPLINNDKVIGILMGLGESTAYNKPTLQMVERVASEMLAKFIPSKMNKAA